MASGEKEENGAGEGSKRWVLKTLLKAKIYPETMGSNGRALRKGVI